MILRRLRRPDVVPLEVWNLPVAGRALWQLVGVPPAEALAAGGVCDLDASLAMARAVAAALRALHPRHRFDAVHVGGGLLEREDFRAMLGAAPLPCPVSFAADGPFCAEPGGRALLAEVGAPAGAGAGDAGGAVVDVGQTAIKASGASGRRVRERDLEALPLQLIGAPRRPAAATRAAAAAFIAGAIAAVGPASRLVLALPCPVDDAGTPGACTYGWEGDRDLVPEVLRRLDPTPDQVLLLNDAELFAESTRLRPEAAGRRLLCLTLGFGPGAALLG